MQRNKCYKSLSNIGSNRSKLDYTKFDFTCSEDEPKRVVHQYLESMFFEPLAVPEQAKYIQAPHASSGR